MNPPLWWLESRLKKPTTKWELSPRPLGRAASSMPPTLLPKYDYTRVALDQSFKYFSWFSGGLGHIDIEDWKCHTRLKHCNPETQIVRWFWEILDEYSEEMRARLLQFVTGSSRVRKLFSTLPKFFVVCRFNPFFLNERSQKTDLELFLMIVFVLFCFDEKIVTKNWP